MIYYEFDIDRLEHVFMKIDNYGEQTRKVTVSLPDPLEIPKLLDWLNRIG